MKKKESILTAYIHYYICFLDVHHFCAIFEKFGENRVRKMKWDQKQDIRKSARNSNGNNYVLLNKECLDNKKFQSYKMTKTEQNKTFENRWKDSNEIKKTKTKET